MTGRNGHDPLCDVQHMTSCLWAGDVCVRCRLIAKVREDERQRVRATVIPILVALARYTPTDTNAEQTEQVINRAVMRIKSAIDNEEE